MGDLKIKNNNSHWEEYGLKTGTPVFYFHCIPGSSLEPSLSHQMALKLGIRLIAPELPGIGQSDYIEGFKLDVWPSIIAKIADSLSIGTFSIFGFSGGGVFALACANSIPKRINKVTLLGCSAPFESDVMQAHFPESLKQMYNSASNCYSETILQFEQLITSPDVLMQMILSSYSEEDQQLFLDNEIQNNYKNNCKSIIKQGVKGAVSSMRIVCEHWGFELKDIATPVIIWQGLKDQVIHPEISRYLANNLQQATLYEVQNKGHFLHFSDWKSVLESSIN